MTKKYTVYGSSLSEKLGESDNFTECKEIHRKWLEETNHPDKERYAGLACDGDYLREGMAFPAFYME